MDENAINSFKHDIYHNFFLQFKFFKDLIHKHCFCQKTSSVLNKNSEKLYIKNSSRSYNLNQ